MLRPRIAGPVALLGFILGFPLAAAVADATASAEPQLAPNPGFEEVDDPDWVQAWSRHPGVYTRSTESPHQGQYCLRFENAAPERYILSSAPIALRPGRQYEVEVWVRTESVTGEDSGATICLQWWGQDGAFVGGCYPSGVKGTQREWTAVRGRSARIPPEAVRCDVTCYVRKGMTGTAWWDDVSVREYQPPVIESLVTDVYRGTTAGGPVRVLAGLNLAGRDLVPDRVEARLAVLGPAGRPALPDVTGTVTPTAAEFGLDTAPLAPGTYALVCRLSNRADGAALGSATSRLYRVATAPQRRAYIDPYRRLIVDGAPFFPLGMYWGGLGDQQQLEMYAKSPFNCLMPYGGATVQQMDALQARGLRLIYSIKDWYHGTTWCPKSITRPEDERPAIEAKVRERCAPWPGSASPAAPTG